MAAVVTTRTAGASWAESAASQLAISVHQLDITPRAGDASGWMSGYGWGPRGTGGTWATARRLRAQCAVIWDDGWPNVVLRTDLANITRGVHQAVRGQILDEGLVGSSADFLMAASHTHSGPFVGYGHLDETTLINLQPADIDAVTAWTDTLIEHLVQTVRLAVATPPVAVTLHYGEGSAPIGANRAGLPYTLPNVSVLVAKAGNGTPQAVLFGHACHPVCRPNDTVYDSDHCGYAAELVESRLGVPALFFQGTAGDQNPTGTQSTNLIAQHGTTLGNAVVAVATSSLPQVTGPLRNFYTEIDLPLVVDLSDPVSRASIRSSYQSRLDVYPNDDSAEGAARRHAQIMVDTLDDPSMWSVPMPIQCWHLGGLTILALAHEVTSGYTVGLKNNFSGLPLWVMAYANETEIYVPADEGLWAGGYEAGWSGSNILAGIGTSLIPYTWPCPLKSSPQNPPPPPIGAPGSAPRTVWDACVDLITS
jgi:neutral ceramidase